MGQTFGTLANAGAAIPGPQQPFVAGAAALFDIINGASQQSQAANAASADYGNVSSLARQLATQSYIPGIEKAENSGLKTLMTNQGGIANPGAFAKDAMGGNIENAIQGALAGRSANLESAAGLYNNLGNTARSSAQQPGWLSGIPGLIGLATGGGGGGQQPDSYDNGIPVFSGSGSPVSPGQQGYNLPSVPPASLPPLNY